MTKKNTQTTSQGKLTRRQILTTSVAASTLAMAPTIVPNTVFGGNGRVGPNDKIILGGIGVGNRGSYVLSHMLREPDVHFVADCDPQKARAERVKKNVDDFYDNTDCKLYNNINEFLAERTDIDAVLSTTGDRLHATAAVFAMRAGKDVYSEKPSCMTIAEGRAVVETAKRYGRIYQTGTQRVSQDQFVFCDQMVAQGRLGEVKTVRAHIAPWDAAKMRHDWLPAQPEPPKEEVDWDAWLGPCPWRPYNADYCKGRWRGHYDFHTSCIGEWGAHTFAQCQVAIGATNTAAIDYKYVDNESGDGMVTTFANGVQMILERDMDKKYWHGSCGVRYEGSEGWVATADGYEAVEASSKSLLADYDKIIDEYIERTGRPVRGQMRHVRNFFDCIKTRKPTIANPELMHYSMTTTHAANICMWLQRDLQYDPVKEEFPNDPEANRYRSRAMREPWVI
jgi:hypothetical protein